MSWHGYSRLDLAAIAAGGVVGATLRWLISQPWPNEPADSGWFAYAPNASVTLTNETPSFGFDAVSSSQNIGTASGVPIDTLIANLLGCLLLGGLTMLLGRSAALPRRLLIAAATGICGSLTTFSTFAVEVATLLRAKPILPAELNALSLNSDRNEASLLTYLALSIVGGALAFYLGRTATARAVTTPGDGTIGRSS